MENLESNYKFEYMMLGRLQMDCKYYLGCGGRYAGHLWVKDEEKQIKEMRRIYKMLPVKPKWLKLKKINKYSKKMIFDKLTIL